VRMKVELFFVGVLERMPTRRGGYLGLLLEIARLPEVITMLTRPCCRLTSLIIAIARGFLGLNEESNNHNWYGG